MSQNIRPTPWSAGRHGRIANVDGSGIAIMSDSSIALKPVIDEPSKPMPPSKAASSSAALMENDFSWPRMSVNHSRMNRMWCASTRALTSAGVVGWSVAIGPQLASNGAEKLCPQCQTRRPKRSTAGQAGLRGAERPRFLDGAVGRHVAGDVDHRGEALERHERDRLEQLLVGPARFAGLLDEVRRQRAGARQLGLQHLQQRELTRVHARPL